MVGSVSPAPSAKHDQIALDASAKILGHFVEPISGVQLKARIQVTVLDAIWEALSLEERP